MHCIGIDISKQTPAVFDGRQQETFPNQPGLEFFDRWLTERFPPGTPAPALIFEATGVYSHELTRFCHRRQLAVHCLNPKRSHHFRGAIGQRSKNDPLDARILYAYHLILPEEAYAVPRSDRLVETLHHFLSLSTNWHRPAASAIRITRRP